LTGLAKIRASYWSVRAIRQARRQLGSGGLDAIRLKPPPNLPPDAERAVRAPFRLWGQTCLVHAAVLQEWFASQGEYRDIVIGVKAPNSDFQAHAWLDGDPPCHSEGFEELLRRPSRR
jgi:Transglutaminase-like superfamily